MKQCLYAVVIGLIITTPATFKAQYQSVDEARRALNSILSTDAARNQRAAAENVVRETFDAFFHSTASTDVCGMIKRFWDHYGTSPFVVDPTRLAERERCTRDLERSRAELDLINKEVRGVRVEKQTLTTEKQALITENRDLVQRNQDVVNQLARTRQEQQRAEQQLEEARAAITGFRGGVEPSGLFNTIKKVAQTIVGPAAVGAGMTLIAAVNSHENEFNAARQAQADLQAQLETARRELAAAPSANAMTNLQRQLDEAQQQLTVARTEAARATGQLTALQETTRTTRDAQTALQKRFDDAQQQLTAMQAELRKSQQAQQQAETRAQKAEADKKTAEDRTSDEIKKLKEQLEQCRKQLADATTGKKRELEQLMADVERARQATEKTMQENANCRAELQKRPDATSVAALTRERDDLKLKLTICTQSQSTKDEEFKVLNRQLADVKRELAKSHQELGDCQQSRTSQEATYKVFKERTEAQVAALKKELADTTRLSKQLSDMKQELAALQEEVTRAQHDQHQAEAQAQKAEAYRGAAEAREKVLLKQIQEAERMLADAKKQAREAEAAAQKAESDKTVAESLKTSAEARAKIAAAKAQNEVNKAKEQLDQCKKQLADCQSAQASTSKSVTSKSTGAPTDKAAWIKYQNERLSGIETVAQVSSDIRNKPARLRSVYQEGRDLRREVAAALKDFAAKPHLTPEEAQKLQQYIEHKLTLIESTIYDTYEQANIVQVDGYQMADVLKFIPSTATITLEKLPTTPPVSNVVYEPHQRDKFIADIVPYRKYPLKITITLHADL